MTFGEIKQALYDRIGVVGVTPLAGTVTRVERTVNEGLQKVGADVDWPGLLASFSITSFSSTGTTMLDTKLRKVVSVLDAAGIPLDMKSVEAFEDFYRGDTYSGTPAGSATKPSVCCVDAFKPSTGELTISTWPVFTGAPAGSVRGYRLPTKLTNDTDVPELPSGLHHLIVDEAVARLRESEESANVQVVGQVATQNMGQAARPG